MRYRLKEGLYHCIAGRNVIFLDLSRNRYFALPSTSTVTFRQLVARNGETVAGAEAALSSLIDAGYLLEAADSDLSFKVLEIEAPAGDAYSRNEVPHRLWPLLVAVYSELRTSLRIRLFPLHSVFARSAISRRVIGRDEHERKTEVDLWVSAFERAALILGRSNRCLTRSLAMFSVLRARGVTANLVIGVRSEPFSAHAWVQYEGTVLNDTFGQINNYSPILVLR
ncbi:lasso peptide biosynthesis B2 protein [Sphingomonas panacis]|uniref:lasso peptide biosynthesis B2 protein n=1 Tax=Sphingomonas panacis TaxID=1560345 RepID=UPI0009F6FC63|nr:lasso peptide biosynthesis B2 protein [Sphingomonas panacis]